MQAGGVVPQPGLAARVDAGAGNPSAEDSLNIVRAAQQPQPQRDAWVQAVNSEAPAPPPGAPRVVARDQGELLITHLIVNHLLPRAQLGLLSVFVIAAGPSLEARRKVRMRQEGQQPGQFARSASWSGPHSYEPRGQGQIPQLVKRYGSWRWRGGGQEVTVYGTKIVPLVPAPGTAALRVLAVGLGGMRRNHRALVLTLSAVHPFAVGSEATFKLLTVTGLHESVDGFAHIVFAAAGSSTLEIVAPAAFNQDEIEAANARLASKLASEHATVTEEYVQHDELEVYHLRCAPLAAAEAQQAQQAVEHGAAEQHEQHEQQQQQEQPQGGQPGVQDGDLIHNPQAGQDDNPFVDPQAEPSDAEPPSPPPSPVRMWPSPDSSVSSGLGEPVSMSRDDRAAAGSGDGGGKGDAGSGGSGRHVSAGSGEEVEEEEVCSAPPQPAPGPGNRWAGLKDDELVGWLAGRLELRPYLCRNMLEELGRASLAGLVQEFGEGGPMQRRRLLTQLAATLKQRADATAALRGLSSPAGPAVPPPPARYSTAAAGFEQQQPLPSAAPRSAAVPSTLSSPGPLGQSGAAMAAAQGGAQALAQAIDGGRSLSEHEYSAIVHDASAQPGGLIAAINAAAPPRQRVVLLPEAGATNVLLPAMIEEHLIAPHTEDPSECGVVVVQPAALQALKKRRAATLSEGINYEGKGFPGRVNFLPSSRDAVPLIGKRSATWRRTVDQQGGEARETHKVTGYEVRVVAPVEAPPPALAVASTELECDGTGNSKLRTAVAHPFSGAKQLATLAGLGAGLDGCYAVVAATQGSDAFKVKLPKQSAEGKAALRAAVGQGGVSVREEHALNDSYTLYHFMLPWVAPPALPAPAAAAVVAAAQPAMAAGAEQHPPGVFDDMPLRAEEVLQEMGVHPVNYSDLLAHDAVGGQGPSFAPVPAAASLATQVPASELLGGYMGPQMMLPEQQPQQQQQEQQQEQEQQQQQQPAGPRASPAASGSGQAGQAPDVLLPPGASSAEHAQQGGHYRLLTVGGDQPVAGRGEYSGSVLAVLGGMEVKGEAYVQGVRVLSDARAKEHIRVFDESEKAVAVAASLCTYLYNYKGATAQRLGVLAHEVRAVLEAHGLDHLNIVSADAQGQLSVDYGGLQMLVLSALQSALSRTTDLSAAQRTLELATMGRFEQLAAQVRALQGMSAMPGGTAEAEAAPAGSASSASALTTAAAGAGPAPVAGLAASLSSASAASLLESGSMGDLLDSGDVEMGGASEEEEEGSGSYEPPAGEFEGLDDEAVLALLLVRLNEQAGARKLYQKLVSQLSRPALWEVYQEAVAGPRGLTAQGDRSRSLGGQFIKLAKKRAAEEEIRCKAEAAGPEALQLRGYQQRVAEAAKEGGNLILVAPTGAGKTAVAVAHAVHVLQGNPEGRVVFLAPTMALALQQTAAFYTAAEFRSGALTVSCRTGDNPVAARDWDKVLQEHHVLVMTPQLLLNMLREGAAHFHQLALLCIDECHHAKDNHPTSMILAHYRCSSRTTQILGLTASPVSKASLEATYAGLLELKRNLDAQYVILDERDEELLRVVPQVHQQEVLVPVASHDADFARQLGGFVAAAVELLCSQLGLAGLPAEVLGMLREGKWCGTAARWTVTAAEQLQLATAGVQHPGGSQAPAAPAAAGSQAGAAPVPSAAAPAGMPAGTPPASTPPQLAEADVHDVTSALLLVRAAVAALALVSDVGFEVAVRHLSQQYWLVAAKLVHPGAPGTAPGTTAPPAAPPARPLTAGLLQRLAQDVVQEADVSDSFKGEAATLSRHPKFKALKDQLLAFSGRDALHGIVFARTREAVRSLTRLIRASPDLHFLQVFSFMGHGRSKAGGDGGMNSKQQQAVIQQFRETGRHLLVSTSAGEEGIDVPRCEFVIRFNPTQTGRERVQSAGRARKLGSRFIEIVEATAAELELVRKARQEEQSMRQALAGLTSMRL